jgi:hypothetical protein
MYEKLTPKKANCLYITLHLLQMKSKDISAFRLLLKSFKMEACNPSIDRLDFDDIILVHGLVNSRTSPNCVMSKKINHAWLEFGGCVIENSAMNALIVNKVAYYSDFNPENTKSFSIEEAFQILMDGYGVSFWHNSKKFRKVENIQSIDEILARNFILEHKMDNHGTLS